MLSISLSESLDVTGNYNNKLNSVVVTISLKEAFTLRYNRIILILKYSQPEKKIIRKISYVFVCSSYNYLTGLRYRMHLCAKFLW
jgi:tRNA uridine 5-carbamoylmethylation protein Kti12